MRFSDAYSVPRACGAEPQLCEPDEVFYEVFPAPAGLNRPRCYRSSEQRRVPRACGAEPMRGQLAMNKIQVFPAPAGLNRPVYETPSG